MIRFLLLLVMVLVLGLGVSEYLTWRQWRPEPGFECPPRPFSRCHNEGAKPTWPRYRTLQRGGLVSASPQLRLTTIQGDTLFTLPLDGAVAVSVVGLVSGKQLLGVPLPLADTVYQVTFLRPNGGPNILLNLEVR